MSGGQPVTTLPAGLELSAGRIDKIELKGTSGLNPAVGTSLETIHYTGGIRNILTAGEILKVVSSSANDTNTGSAHARRIRIKGLDNDGLYLEEDVNLNGTSVVETVNAFKHINDLRVQKVGTGGDFNDGLITVYANDGTTKLYEIGAGENQQQTAAWHVASNQYGYLTSFVCSATGNAQVSIWGCPVPGSTPFFQKLTVIVGAGGPTPYQLPNPFQLQRGGIIEFRAKSLTGGEVAVGADFQVLLETD